MRIGLQALHTDTVFTTNTTHAHNSLAARELQHSTARRTVLKTAAVMEGVLCAQSGDVLYEWDQVRIEYVVCRMCCL